MHPHGPAHRYFFASSLGYATYRGTRTPTARPRAAPRGQATTLDETAREPTACRRPLWPRLRSSHAAWRCRSTLSHCQVGPRHIVCTESCARSASTDLSATPRKDGDKSDDSKPDTASNRVGKARPKLELRCASTKEHKSAGGACCRSKATTRKRPRRTHTWCRTLVRYACTRESIPTAL